MNFSVLTSLIETLDEYEMKCCEWTQINVECCSRSEWHFSLVFVSQARERGTVKWTEQVEIFMRPHKVKNRIKMNVLCENWWLYIFLFLTHDVEMIILGESSFWKICIFCIHRFSFLIYHIFHFVLIKVFKWLWSVIIRCPGHASRRSFMFHVKESQESEISNFKKYNYRYFIVVGEIHYTFDLLQKYF